MQYQSQRSSWLEKQRYLPSYMHYDPFRVPANIAQSLKHFACTQFGNDDYGSEQCPCCRQLEKRPLGYGCPLSHIETVSHSACAYFHFVVNMIGLSVLVFLINGIVNLVQLVQTCNSDSNLCVYIYGVPFRRFSTYFDYTHEIMDMLTILLLFFFGLWTTYRFRKLHYFERYKVKASDYSILLSGVDHEKVSTEQLVAFFRSDGVADIQVLYTHRIKKYLSAERRKLVLHSKVEHYRHRKAKQHEIEELEEQIRKCDDEMLPIINKFYFNQEMSIRTDKVFIAFESAEVKRAVWKKYKLPEWKRILLNMFTHSSNIAINGCHITFEQAVEPNEIIWENLQVSSRKKYLLILAGNVITLVILCVSFGLIMWLSNIELETANSQDSYLSYVCAIVISLINLVISYALEIMAGREGRYCLTGKFTSLMTKETATFFFNTALIPFSMFFVFHSRDNEEGLILTIISIFFLSAFVNPFLLLLNIQSTIKYFRRRRLLNSNMSAMMTPQSEANEIFEKPSFQLQFKYSVVSKLIMMTIFFAGIFPLGALFAICGLAISYYINKYMLLRHSQLFKVSYRIGRRANRINTLLPGIYGLGIITNEYLIKADTDIINIILFVLSVVLSLIGFLYNQRISKYFIRRWKEQKEPLVGGLTRREAIYSAGVIDYKHLNPTSCEQIRHKELSAPVHESRDESLNFETPQPPALVRADTSSPQQPIQQHLPAVKQEHKPQNRFIRSMLSYANAFPGERS